MKTTPPSPVHYLLVDDLEENLLALEAVLRHGSVVLLKARSGPEALELLLKHDVALALVDVQMPGMDGFELAELMRGTDRTRRVPIIFLTAGTADWQRRFRGYEAGAVDFLQKPLDPDILRSKADVFFELYCQREEVARRRDELEAAVRENARLLAESQRAAAALRDADRRKDEFLATLAHELRNPLAPLRSGLHLLKLDPHGDYAVRVRDMMDRQLTHMVRLIDDLLDVSRVSSGKLVLRTERIALQSVIRNALEGARPLIDATEHYLTVTMPETPIEVEGDPVRLAQVLGNLLTNASKYTPNGGTISLTLHQEEQEAVIRVIDSGTGIPADMLPKIFDLFTQVGTELDRSQGGLGIGLALVRRLVEMHGGQVTAASEGRGKGCTFMVRLPVLEPNFPESGVETGTYPGDSAAVIGKRVLVVDDNIDAAETLAMLLKLSGHESQTASDGPEALAVAREFRPEVVFLDIGLPGLNGFQVAAQFRQLAPLSDCVLVALTGWGSEQDKQKCLEVGFDHHLTKPVDSAAVLEIVGRIEPVEKR